MHYFPSKFEIPVARTAAKPSVLPEKSSQTIWHTYTRDDQGNKVEVKVNQPPVKDASYINIKRAYQIDIVLFKETSK